MNRAILMVACVLVFLGAARAQNPVQWSGSVSQSVARAQEQMLPLLFWVTGNRDREEDDDLSDAQSECFRDPVVVGIIHKRFVPVRVSRNSRVLAEAEALGLPTSHGLYCAVLTTDKKLLAQMGPGEVADPAVFATRLSEAFALYSQELYQSTLRPLFDDASTPKAQLRKAAQTVYRLGIRSADAAMIRLLKRPDLTPTEKARLCQLLASLGTEASISELLNRGEDKDAAAALARAEPGALQWLIPALPAAEGPVDARQFAAYQGAMRISRAGSPRPKEWWEKSTPDQRREELDRLKARAATVLEYWRQSGGSHT